MKILDTILDTRGLRCPLPVLKAKKAMKALGPGDELTILATDPESPKDFQDFCKTTGDDLIEWSEIDGVFTYRLRKT